MKCGKWQKRLGRLGEWERTCASGQGPDRVFVVRKGLFTFDKNKWEVGIGTKYSITFLPCSFASKAAAMRAATPSRCPQE